MLMQTLPAIISGGGGASLAFHALTPDDTTYEMLGVKVGTGDLTTTHTSDLYVQAEDDKYRLHGANEAVWADGYTLRNRLLHSNNMTDTGVWSQPCTVTFDEIGLDGTANTATYMEDDDGAASEQRLQTVTIPDDSLVNVACCYIKKDATTSRFPEFFVRLQGGTQQQIGVQINTSTGASNKRVSTGTTAHEVIDAGDWWLLVVSVQNNSTGNVEALVAIYPAAGATLGNWDESATGSIIVGNVELHLNSTIAKVKLPTDGWIITSTAALSKTWAIDAAGAPLASAPYLHYYPAATNIVLSSNNFIGTGWGGTGNSFDQIGLTGESNTASLNNDTNASGHTTAAQTISLTSSSNTHILKVYVKKDTDETRFPAARIRYLNGTFQQAFCSFNTKTGATSFITTTGTAAAESVDLGDWWAFLVSLADNGSGNNSMDITLYGAAGTTIGVEDTSAQGSTIFGNIEFYLASSFAQVRGLGPIFTTSASVSTDATAYTVDQTNYPGGDTEAVFFTECQVTQNAVDSSTDDYIWNPIGFTLMTPRTLSGAYRYGYKNTGGSNVNANVSGATSPAPLDTNILTGYACHDGTNEFQARVDDGGGATDGTLHTTFGTIRPGEGATLNIGGGSYATKIRNGRFYTGNASFSAAKATLDGLIP